MTACPSSQTVDPGTFEEKTECQGSRRARTWPRNHVQRQKSRVEKALCSIFLGTKRGRIVSKLALTACPSGQAVDPGTFEE